VRLAVAVSGGGDSLAALTLLREAGHEVVALHGRFLPDADDPKTLRAESGLAEACARLGVELRVLDLRERFEKHVVAPFTAEYLAGRTPNPCARCNAAMKFGALLDAALDLGATGIATGHYARSGAHPVHGWALFRGADPVKDQSYFLSLVPRERLMRAHFPLAAARKTEVRADLAGRGVEPPLPEESQEICFVPGDDYRAFLTARVGALPGPGPAVLPDGTPVGRHQGLWRATIGQRRGLGLSWREPLYVQDKRVADNTLVVAPRPALLVEGFLAREINILADPAGWPEVVLAQTRYRERPAPARVEILGDGLAVRYVEPRTRPAPGQVAALYGPDGAVLAGAVVL